MNPELLDGARINRSEKCRNVSDEVQNDERKSIITREQGGGEVRLCLFFYLWFHLLIAMDLTLFVFYISA